MAAQSAPSDTRTLAPAPTSHTTSADSASTSERAATLRGSVQSLVADLTRGRSLIVAFRLAAKADSFEQPQLFWPDLMQALEQVLPEEGELQDEIDAVFEVVESAQEEARSALASRPAYSSKSRRRAAVAARSVRG